MSAFFSNANLESKASLSQSEKNAQSLWDRYLSPGMQNALKSIYFLITLFALFVILSNSLTAVFKAIWHDAGNNWAVAWDFLLQCVSPRTLFIHGTTLFFVGLFWLVGGIFLYFDFKLTPHLLSRYKIQPYKNEPINRKQLMDTVKLVLFNQLVSWGVIAALYPVAIWRGMSMTLPLPTFERFLLEIGFCIVLEEILFYYSHRLLHNPVFYGLIHKKHHTWTAPYAICAIYAHPIEHLVSNLLPILSGPLILGSHLATAWAWIAIAIINTLNVHSGYHLPFMPSPESHDFHHLRFNQNFGVLGVLDYLHGTDVEFRASKQYLEHKTYFSFDEYSDKHQAGYKIGEKKKF